MNVLLALNLLLGASIAPVTDEVPGNAVAFEVSFIECDAVSWRHEYQTRLRFGGHRSGCSAWVVKSDVLSELSRSFGTDRNASQVVAPPVMTMTGEPAVLGTVTTRHLVVHAEPEQKTGSTPDPDREPTAYRPVIVPFNDGAQVKLSASFHPEGTALNVHVIESRIAAIHEVETLTSKGSTEASSVKVQVPEVNHRELGGEWSLPEDHGLLLSLGVTSSPGDEAEVILRERLLLIAARKPREGSLGPEADFRIQKAGIQTPVPISPPVSAPSLEGPNPFLHGPNPGLPQHGPVPVALAATPWGLLPIVPVDVEALGRIGAAIEANQGELMPLPELPSRNLPLALGSDGDPIDPRTEKDRHAERTMYSPYLDGQPVPSPQVTIPSPEIDERPANDGNPIVTASPSAIGVEVVPSEEGVAKRDASVVSVRLSLDLIKGFSIDLDFGNDEPDVVEAKAEPVKSPARR